MTKIKNDNLVRFGFSFKYGSVHTKRTMMLNELCMAFDYVDEVIEKAMELAQEASRKGWIVFKRVGSVIEVQFPNLLTPEEMEWIREQS